jgi:hypothetical protein
MSMENDGRMILTGETEELGAKPIPVPLCPPQISHGLTWARTRDFSEDTKNFIIHFTVLTCCLNTKKRERRRAWPRRQSGASRIVSKQNASSVEYVVLDYKGFKVVTVDSGGGM